MKRSVSQCDASLSKPSLLFIFARSAKFSSFSDQRLFGSCFIINKACKIAHNSAENIEDNGYKRPFRWKFLAGLKTGIYSE